MDVTNGSPKVNGIEGGDDGFVQRPDDIVITGISGKYPSCNSIAEFEKYLLKNLDMITISDERWPPGYAGLPERHGWMPDISSFDNAFFGVHSKQAEFMDPQIKALLELTYEAFVDAGISLQDVSGTNTGVYIGCSVSEPGEAWNASKNIAKQYVLTGCSRNMMANRLSYAFNMKGLPSYYSEFLLETFNNLGE